MEKYRRISLLVTTALLFGIQQTSLLATGGDSFDEPAPSLADSLDFLPGKSLGEIFLETDAHPSDQEKPDFDAEVKKLAERLRSEPAAPLVTVADELLKQARQHYSGGDWCNLLHDVRDVLVGSADNKTAAADYIKWRIENKNLFGSSSPKEREASEERKDSNPVRSRSRKAREECDGTAESALALSLRRFLVQNR